MKIRPAKQSDYEQLIQLCGLLVGDDRYINHDNDSFEKVLNSPNNNVYVAEEDEKLIGFVTFSVRTVLRYPKPIAELDELFVHEDYRKHGVGKQFMSVIEEKARELGCYRMYIESGYQHKLGHIFYEKIGYKNYGYHFLKNL